MPISCVPLMLSDTLFEDSMNNWHFLRSCFAMIKYCQTRTDRMDSLIYWSLWLISASYQLSQYSSYLLFIPSVSILLIKFIFCGYCWRISKLSIEDKSVFITVDVCHLSECLHSTATYPIAYSYFWWGFHEIF